ncbi:MAG TPA: glutathione peroxidase [Solirubrobacterales bacterium]|jgi:glutathione peroxidase|nr:glutathione peroxidase [Solirubrobacterales bacterium]
MSRIARYFACALALVGAVTACGSDPSADGDGSEAAAGGTQAALSTTSSDLDAEQPTKLNVLDHTLPLLDGSKQDLARYRGKVVLVVNTAGECGFAPQFGGLESLYRERRKEGLVVLGFPADDIVGQEPRSDEEIAEFCRANFGVTFPMFSRSNVVDDPVNPLFAELAAALGEPTYNFNKYLIDRRGRPVGRFDQSTEPDDPELTRVVDSLLAA